MHGKGIYKAKNSDPKYGVWKNGKREEWIELTEFLVLK
jgi:hypothetical protein